MPSTAVVMGALKVKGEKVELNHLHVAWVLYAVKFCSVVGTIVCYTSSHRRQLGRAYKRPTRPRMPSSADAVFVGFSFLETIQVPIHLILPSGRNLSA